MNLDYGKLLSRSWQITWKYKVLWVIATVPMLVFIPFLIIFFPLIFFLGIKGNNNGVTSTTPIYLAISIILGIGISLGCIFISPYTMAAATEGVIRAERGEGSCVFSSRSWWSCRV